MARAAADRTRRSPEEHWSPGRQRLFRELEEGKALVQAATSWNFRSATSSADSPDAGSPASYEVPQTRNDMEWAATVRLTCPFVEEITGVA